MFITYKSKVEFNKVGATRIPVMILSSSIKDLIISHNIKYNTHAFIRYNNNNPSIFIFNIDNPKDKQWDMIEIVE